MNLKHRERITVQADDEEIDVFNWVNVTQPATVRGHNPAVETYQADIGAGDASFTPEAVTPWVAEELSREFYIDVEEHGIDVIDPTDDGVTVL